MYFNVNDPRIEILLVIGGLGLWYINFCRLLTPNPF